MIWIAIPVSLFLAVHLVMWGVFPANRSRANGITIIVLIFVLLVIAGVYDTGFRN